MPARKQKKKRIERPPTHSNKKFHDLKAEILARKLKNACVFYIQIEKP